MRVNSWWFGSSTSERLLEQWNEGIAYKKRQGQSVQVLDAQGAKQWTFGRHPYRRIKAVLRHPQICEGLDKGLLKLSAPVVFSPVDTWVYCSPRPIYHRIYPCFDRHHLSDYDLEFALHNEIDNADSHQGWVDPVSWLARNAGAEVTREQYKADEAKYNEAQLKERDRMLRRGCDLVHQAQRDAAAGKPLMGKIWVRSNSSDLTGLTPRELPPDARRFNVLTSDDVPSEVFAFEESSEWIKDKEAWWCLGAVPLNLALHSQELEMRMQAKIRSLARAHRVWLPDADTFKLEMYIDFLSGMYRFTPISPLSITLTLAERLEYTRPAG